jgi:hypothetical protein
LAVEPEDQQTVRPDVAIFGRTAAESGNLKRSIVGRSCVEKPDLRHRWLLRAPRERPRNRRCAAEKRNELTSPHIRTQFRGQHCIGLNQYFDSAQTSTLIVLKTGSKTIAAVHSQCRRWVKT